MPLVKSFEELLSWKKARELNKFIYTETLKPTFAKDFVLKDQIRRSSTSIMSNIAEGFERGTDSEFRYFLRVAKGSAGELRSQLYIANDLNYIDKDSFNKCHEQTKEISRLLSGFINKLNYRITQTKIPS